MTDKTQGCGGNGRLNCSCTDMEYHCSPCPGREDCKPTCDTCSGKGGWTSAKVAGVWERCPDCRRCPICAGPPDRSGVYCDDDSFHGKPKCGTCGGSGAVDIGISGRPCPDCTTAPPDQHTHEYAWYSGNPKPPTIREIMDTSQDVVTEPESRKPPKGMWTCACGLQNNTKWCKHCDNSKRPDIPKPPASSDEAHGDSHDWYCVCGHWNGCNLAVCAVCGRKAGFKP